jgi:hypothetical protein
VFLRYNGSIAPQSSAKVEIRPKLPALTVHNFNLEKPLKKSSFQKFMISIKIPSIGVDCKYLYNSSQDLQ